MLAFFHADYPTTRLLLEQSLAMWQMLGDPTGIAYARHYLAYLRFMQGESDLAFSYWDAGGKHFRSIGDSWGLAWTLAFLGRAARESGDHAAALVYYQESAQSAALDRRPLGSEHRLEPPGPDCLQTKRLSHGTDMV